MIQVENTRQSGGNQDLNHALYMKANELDKLFEQYKLQSSRTSTSRSVDAEQVESSSLHEKHQVEPKEPPDHSSSGMVESHVSSLMRIADAQRQNNMQLGLCQTSMSKGKFYDKYMEKRDAKLRAEGFHQKAEKMRAMHESLERTRAEMILTTKYGEDLSLHGRQEIVSVTSFTITSTMKNILDQPWSGYVKDRDDEYLPEFPRPQASRFDRSLSGAVLGADGSSRSSQPKKLLRNRTLSSPSSTTVPTSAPLIPRPSIKSSVSFSGRRRVQPEIPLPQTVSNSSDFRKENTKPPPAVPRKATTQSQFTNKQRSKSTNESHSYKLFDNDYDSFIEQVQVSGTSIPTPPADFKLGKDHISGSSIKAPKSFFSLSSLRSKGSNSKHR